MAGVLVVLLIGVGMVVGVVAETVGGARRSVPVPVPSALAADARRVGRWSWAGLIVGLAAAVAVSRWDRLGRGLLLAAPLLGLAVLAGTIGGELAVTGPMAATRRAGLRARRVGDYLPRRATAAVVAAVVALAATAAGAILASSDDDRGRAGRWLTSSCSPDRSSSRGPWPGWFYSGPLLAVVGVGLVLAAVALRAIVNRPRLTAPVAAPPGSDASVARPGRALAPSAAEVAAAGESGGPGGAPPVVGTAATDAATATADDAEALALDEAMRRWAARRVVAACAMVVALPLLGTASVAAVALAGADCLPAGGRVAGAALVVVAPLASVLLGWSAQALLIPAGVRARTGSVAR